MKTSLKHGFAPLRQAALAFFRFDVSLRRQDGRLRLVFSSGQPGRAGKSSPRTRQAAALADRELALARTALAQLLDANPSTRSSLRGLAAIEDALAREQWASLSTVPRGVLHVALSEFEELITNWSDEGLAALRSRMAVALSQRASEEPEGAIEHDFETAVALGPRDTAARAIQRAMAPAEEDDAAALLAAYEVLGVGAAERQGN